MMRAVGAVLAVAACTSTEVRDPDDFTPTTPLAPVPSLGPVLAESSRLRGSVLGSGLTDERGYVMVFEAEGYDAQLVLAEASTRFFTTDLETGMATDAPPPPLPPTGLMAFGTHTRDGAVVRFGGATEADDFMVGIFEDGAWTMFPGPSGIAFSTITEVTARDGEAFMRAGADNWFYDGTTWRTLAFPAGAETGPWDETGLVAVYPVGTTLCTQRFSPAALAGSGGPDAEVCTELGIAGLASGARNGTPADFQVLVFDQSALCRVAHVTATPTVGDPITCGPLAATPGGSRAVLVGLTEGVAPYPTLTAVAVTGTNELLLAGDNVELACDCDRDTDRSCSCRARSALFVQSTLNPGATHVQLVIVDDVEASRTVHVRMLALPFAGSAFP